MAKSKSNTKAADKKKERIELQKRIDARIKFVSEANKQEDPLSVLPSFKVFSKNGLTGTLSTRRVADLDESEKNACVDLLIKNMKTLYEKSNWGWSEKNKRSEMMEEAAWYLLAKNEEGKICGFSHFRYDMDFDDEVLYVYEIQIDEEFQRKGLGKFMMQVLEMLAFKADMRKIMLTVLKHNESAVKFFKSNLKFEFDETNPEKDLEWNEKYTDVEQKDYEILSKFNKRKLARESMESLEIVQPKPVQPSGGCCARC